MDFNRICRRVFLLSHSFALFLIGHNIIVDATRSRGRSKLLWISAGLVVHSIGVYLLKVAYFNPDPIIPPNIPDGPVFGPPPDPHEDDPRQHFPNGQAFILVLDPEDNLNLDIENEIIVLPAAQDQINRPN